MLRYAKAISIVCIILSVFITGYSYTIGLERAMQGHEVVLWLHAVGFIVAVSLVAVAAILWSLPKK